MRVNDFLRLVVQETRPRLSSKWRPFQTRTRFTLIQLYYTRRTVHYEVWVRGKERLLEIGLHFEADKTTNAALLDFFAARPFEIKDALGDHVEIEQWTSSWARVHQLMPYEHLDAPTAASAAERLAKMVETLQPMLERAMAPTKRKARL
jgi:hypothetical protein